MVFEVIGVVNPDPQWVSKLDEEHRKIAVKVEENESNCFTYVVLRQENDKGQVTYIVHERFREQSDFDRHFHAPYSEALSKVIMDNNMCSERGFEIKFVKKLAGFESR